jgi:hypothetical protein
MKGGFCVKVVVINKRDFVHTTVDVAVLSTLLIVSDAPTVLAYQKGEILAKSQPIITLLKDFAEPLAYGCYIWAMIRYILGQRPEAIQMFKSVTWGFIGIQILPWIFGIIKSVGDS